MAKRIKLSTWLPTLLAAIALAPLVLNLLGIISIRVVLSDSMSPTINKNDVVITANWIKPMPSDIAIYHQRNIDGDYVQDVVHRVVTINADGMYQFKGDNNKSQDPLLVESKDVSGTVVSQLPAIGKLFNWMGLLVVLSIATGLWLVIYGIKRLRQP
jgi:signal peptidase I